MIRTANNTVMFKDAIGDYEDFFDSEQAQDVIQGINVTVYDPETKAQKFLEPQLWVKEIYRILLRHYRVSEIAFDNVECFLDLLWERIEVHGPNYFQRKSQYERLLSLNDDELIANGVAVQNLTEHTNDREDDVFKPLKNITSQQASKNTIALADGIRNQIYNSRMDLLHDFLRKFEGLFIRLSSSSNYSNNVRFGWQGYTE